MDKYYILTFENTHNAINCESVFKNNNIKAVVMPTPTFVTKSCGISLKVYEEEIEKIKVLMKDKKVKVKGILLKEGSSFKEINLI
ncbi:Protein of unknown function [Clostridium sp. USBA 49]|jgi:uncharacterized Zn ribbon protein|uniref:DUF3343 domain-containing protein n=1 Tax=Clostridium TaxID=1485 RepID=UPI000999639E|nr:MULTISPECIES: DUF3343 domain-containing protein [Clostridium]SKA91543.1 Protein of unknown function [Clostridium sp. USBA 49]